MAAIRGKNTRPELVVRSVLHKLGYRFRIHRKDLPGKPDIVLPRHRVAIFVHGCFWHSHDCRYGAVQSKTREIFWKEKRRRTVERDRLKANELVTAGWRIITVWECQTRDLVALKKSLTDALSESG